MRLSFLALLAATAFSQTPVTFEGRPAISLSNDKLQLITLNKGGAFVSLILKSDPAKTDPMWNPIRLARETGGSSRFGDSLGHFVCVDGFGPSSPDEQAAGLEGHGEAHRQPWDLQRQERHGDLTSLTWQTHLPLVQERFTRTVSLREGEQVIHVFSTLENELLFDRPINWAEHATIGAPFLSPGKTVIDESAGQCQTRPYEGNPPMRNLASGRDFAWPLAPAKAGGTRDVRGVPSPPNSMDHTACTVDPSREWGFVTAINTESKLLIGYLFRREEYPWVQEWMNYPASGALSRGLEFGTQPYDVSHRQTVETGKMFGVPAYRWLPAKSRIQSHFLMFLTQVPDKFGKVDDVRWDKGELLIEDRHSGQTVRLKAEPSTP